MNPILQVKDLSTHFFSLAGPIKAVQNLSFSLRKGEVLGIIGESGCGKSVTGLSIMGLIPSRQGKITNGTIILNGKALEELPEKEMRRVRGNSIAMIFQEPMTSLNPVMTIGDQIGEVFQIHQKLPKNKAKKRSLEMLDLVKLPDPSRTSKEYPHQLSGGMRQRIMIAMALSCKPEILIADEPTTALDVTIQAQILDLLNNLRSEFGTSIILITHNFGILAEMATRIIVMYAGRKIEEAPAGKLFYKSQHPYTRGLMLAVPRLDKRNESNPIKRSKLAEISGTVPSPSEKIIGCAFSSRCSIYNKNKCNLLPNLFETDEGHYVACWNAETKIV